MKKAEFNQKLFVIEKISRKIWVPLTYNFTVTGLLSTRLGG